MKSNPLVIFPSMGWPDTWKQHSESDRLCLRLRWKGTFHSNWNNHGNENTTTSHCMFQYELTFMQTSDTKKNKMKLITSLDAVCSDYYSGFSFFFLPTYPLATNIVLQEKINFRLGSPEHPKRTQRSFFGYCILLLINQICMWLKGPIWHLDEQLCHFLKQDTEQRHIFRPEIN